MKLICVQNDPGALKIVVAAHYTKQDVSITAPSRTKKNLSSTLVLDSGVELFSSNSACSYILEASSGSNNAIEVQEFLEWEATKLNPLVSSLIVGVSNGKKAESSEVGNCLKQISDALKGKPYLVDNKLSAADIVIWSTLYPLVSEQKLSKIVPSDLSEWHNKLSSLDSFRAAVEKLNPKSGVENWASSIPPVTIQFSNLSIAPSAVKSQGSLKLPVANPVLPVKGKKNILITSALPYVNNVPHLGNIIGCVLSADVFARYCRARGHPTLYISGTDEYGTATETKAIAEGLTPKQICDKYHEIHSQVYKWFNIGFDHFGRTSHEHQTEICQDLFLKLHKRGLTLTESMEQLLCENCDRFLADRFVEGECPLCGYEDARGDQCDKCGKLVNATELKNPRCKLCQKKPVTKESKHFFIDLPKIEPKLREWMATSSPGWTNNASVIAHSWIKDGLKPRCITRDLKWGIPVPLDGYREKVFYVWFDAPLGYVSMTKTYTNDWEKWWKNPEEVEYYQFMAKDNVPFHAVMFPSTQLGSGDNFTIVNHIMATEYLNYEDGKFSKSRGVGVFGSDVQDTGIPADVWRFYLLYVRPESQDSSFSWNDLMTKNNSELLNNLGNFINRALMFVEKNFDSSIPKVEFTAEDNELVKNINEELVGYNEALEKAKLRDGLRFILAVSRHGNQYMQSNQPWVLVKGNEAEKKRAGSILGLSANIACLIAALLRPYMPCTTETISKQLQAPGKTAFDIPDTFSILLPENHKIGKPAPLFSKIDAAQADQLKARFAGSQEDQAARSSGGKPTPPSLSGDVAALQAAVAAQGEKVRKLKSETKDKTVWQPEVNILLDLKKKLTEAEKAAAAAPPPPQASGEDIDSLTAAVAAQGEKVRKLKAETKDKNVWQPEVQKLLDLKKRLEAASKNAPPKAEAAQPAPPASASKASELEAAVAAQGEVVRKLKAETKDKTVWQPEVDKLLLLKKQLAEIQGVPATQTQSGGKSGKKKK
ncbi:Hypothetical predicted protein [Cloeon dipterum]|uniref:Methionine--tRNA ligase, cytoplasmic n=1 Tax=Cloeon dipterum TaxID=197152 RepID=A0A8S1DE67_9INSE|nr:Hypothetical predicted protein [Cloeon dipterum]